MQARKEKNGCWLLRLDRKEEIRAEIEKWAKKENVLGAWVQGVGGVANVELVAYDEGKGEWVKRRFSECATYELLSLAGNINEDGLHAHVVISDLNFNSFGGHLLEAQVAVFGEFFVTPTEFIGKTDATVAGASFRKMDLKKGE